MKILENIVKPGNNNHYLLNGCTLTEAKSEEVLPCPSPSPSTLPESKNSHRKCKLNFKKIFSIENYIAFFNFIFCLF